MTSPDPRDPPDASAELKRRLDAALLAGEVGTFEWRVAEDECRGDRNFNRIFGLALDEGVAAPIARYLAEIVEEDRFGVREHLGRVVEAGGSFNMEYRLRDGDRPRWVVVRGVAERNRDGRVSRLTGAILDITDRKRAEQALEQAILQADEANRQKDHFLAMLGHELRNPLGPIRNAVAFLRRIAPAEPRLRGAHELIERQVVLMTRLIDDLLDVSRIARGKVTLKRSEFDLAALLRTAVEDHRTLFEANNIALTLSVPQESMRAKGDSARIAQIVSNLLVNANKFTNPGGSAAVELSASGVEATIRVRDTGIGIDPETLRMLFEPFAQADRSIDRSRGGLGLGLALVKGLAELHGGHIGARSEGLGRGTEFTVVLPILQPGISASAGPVPANEGGPQPHRILIVEDNVDAAETLKSLLELGGHEVSVEHTGAKGVEAAKREHPDVVLCDIGLPGGMDGYAVGEAMRRDPELVKVKLIALTGYGQEEDKQRARSAGFDRHLTKPIDPDALERLLAD